MCPHSLHDNQTPRASGNSIGLPQPIRFWLGDSRGRWEGSTLIVETTNFSPKSSLLGSAENLHVADQRKWRSQRRPQYRSSSE
jgi:hypothetical protein